jgi:hypothetical protein
MAYPLACHSFNWQGRVKVDVRALVFPEHTVFFREYAQAVTGHETGAG